MADIEDDGFDKAFEGFGEDKPTTVVEPPKDDSKPAEPAAPATPAPADPAAPKPAEEVKKDEPAKPEEPAAPAADDAKKAEEGAKPAAAPETPAAPTAAEEAKPLTKADIEDVVTKIRSDERLSTEELSTATDEVIEAYYPDGLSNVLVDQKSGKELRTPQDVVDVTNGDMSMEEAAKWLMNEQYQLDTSIAKIKEDARGIAENTLKFKQDGETVLRRYDPLFKWQPALQRKVWDSYKKLVKADEAKSVILSVPDMLDFYDTVLEPYQKAFEHSTGQSATAPTAPVDPAAPVTPGADDRLDEGGDGGASAVNDPNDFAQQVGKELAKGI